MSYSQALVIEAERVVLGAILARGSRFVDVAGALRPEDFFRDAHQTLWRAYETLATANKGIDWLSVQAQLGAKNLERVGGPAYLASLTDGHVVGSLDERVAFVRNASTVRRLRSLAERIVTATEDTTQDAGELLTSVEQELYGLGQTRQRSTFVTFADVVSARLMPGLDALLSGTHVDGVIPTGFQAIDKVTRGLIPGQLVLLAARPSMGKTSLAMNMVTRIAATSTPVAVFSLEQSTEELSWRAVFAEARLNGHRILRGDIRADDEAPVTQAMGALAELPIYINDQSGLTVAEVHAQARRMVARHGVKVVVLDYLQLLRSSRKGGSRNEDVTEMSQGLKALAKDLRIPVLALSQLSRAPETRGDHKPVLSDLRDSGSLEQDADAVWFLYREEVYDPSPVNTGLADVIIAKSRNGPIGSVELTWHREATRFDERGIA